MSYWSYFYDTQITVAAQSGEDADDMPTYGTQETVNCKQETVKKREATGNGLTVDTADKLITHERAFAKTDAIWLPGADTSKTKEAVFPEEVGSDTTGTETLYWAIL